MQKEVNIERVVIYAGFFAGLVGAYCLPVIDPMPFSHVLFIITWLSFEAVGMFRLIRQKEMAAWPFFILVTLALLWLFVGGVWALIESHVNK